MSKLDPAYELYLEVVGQSEPIEFADLVAQQFLATSPQVHAFQFYLPIQRIGGSLTPGGYLALDIYGFDDDWYDQFAEPTAADEQAKVAHVGDVLTALVQHADARLAYVSQGIQDYPGPISPDQQSAQVYMALTHNDSAGVAHAVWDTEAPRPAMLALAQRDPLLAVLRHPRSGYAQRERNDGVLLISAETCSLS